MNYLGSRALETDRLMLRAETVLEQKRLWEIMLKKEVRDNYLAISKNKKSDLLDWRMYEQCNRIHLLYSKEDNIFEWSVFLKYENICIGKISLKIGKISPDEFSIDYFIDPNFQNFGYGNEVIKKVLDYMFYDVDIKSVMARVKDNNYASKHLLEKYGFVKEGESLEEFTFINDKVLCDNYLLTRNNYLKLERKLH